MEADAALTATLRALLPAAEGLFRDPWCVIGSAALRLHGIEAVSPRDVDLLTSARDAEALIRAWPDRLDAGYAPADDGRFRSRFARLRMPGLPLEAMGGLEVRSDGVWRVVQVPPLRWLQHSAGTVPVAETAALAAMLRLFGREKDLAKVQLLERL